MAKVRGSLILIVVPLPGKDSISISPPNLSRLVLTTSMPTPRPDTSVIFSAIEKPGINIKYIFSFFDIILARSSVNKPLETAFAASFSPSKPFPSSAISILTCPAS